jgi:hypothetical protein
MSRTPVSDQLRKDLKAIDDERPKNDYNEYLVKKQKIFAANEWEQTLLFQLWCAKQPRIKIGTKEYNARTINNNEEIDIANKVAIWERLFVSYQIIISNMTVKDTTNAKLVNELKNKILELKKAVDKADTEMFVICALYFYGIPGEVALDNKEMLMPYVIGRKYLHGKALVGRAFLDIAEQLATEANNSLTTIIDNLSGDQYGKDLR